MRTFFARFAACFSLGNLNRWPLWICRTCSVIRTTLLLSRLLLECRRRGLAWLCFHFTIHWFRGSRRMKENGKFFLEARFFSYFTYSKRSNEQEVKGVVGFTLCPALVFDCEGFVSRWICTLSWDPDSSLLACFFTRLHWPRIFESWCDRQQDYNPVH